MNEKVLNHFLKLSEERKRLQDAMMRPDGFYIIQRRLGNGKFKPVEELAQWQRLFDSSLGEWFYIGQSEPKKIESFQEDELVLKKIENF